MENLYELARRAHKTGDHKVAKTYYEAIGVQNPSDWESYFFLRYYDIVLGPIGQVANKMRELGMSMNTFFDKAKVMCSSDEDFRAAAKTIEEGTSELFDFAIKWAKQDYPVLSTQEEYTDKVFAAFSILLALALSYDFYFPSQELIADATELRKKAIKTYADLVRQLGNGAQLLASGMAEKGFGETISKIKEYDPSYTMPSLMSNTSSYTHSSNSPEQTSSSGCYVATAVYGSYDCPEVWALRRFRDNTLAETWYGRAFVHIYYAVSPTLVKWFGNTNWFKRMWRGRLDKFVSNLMEKGVENTPYSDRQWVK